MDLLFISYIYLTVLVLDKKIFRKLTENQKYPEILIIEIFNSQVIILRKIPNLFIFAAVLRDEYFVRLKLFLLEPIVLTFKTYSKSIYLIDEERGITLPL